MKKILSLFLVLVMILTVFASCTSKNDENDKVQNDSQNENTGETPKEKLKIKIGALKGPTSIGMVKLMKDDEDSLSSNDYEFTVAGTADEITPKLIQGELDIAAVPSNLASVIYNNSNGAVKVLAVNALGVLYIVNKNAPVSSFADLKGKTIYATGKGSIPEYSLKYLLEQNGIDPEKDVNIEWKSESTEIVSAMVSADSAVAMLPQPYVTVAKGQVKELEISLNFTEEWNKLENGSKLITGVIVARKDFIENHQSELEEFLKEYKASTEYVNANVSDAAQLVEKYGIFKAAVAEKAIPYCNITYIAGEEMKSALRGFLNILYEKNPASVGKTLPDENFFYVK